MFTFRYRQGREDFPLPRPSLTCLTAAADQLCKALGTPAQGSGTLAFSSAIPLPNMKPKEGLHVCLAALRDAQLQSIGCWQL